ncbi:TrbC/VirB2 family protein [Xanthomonas citri]|uniref:TrbC/VirB2 family protein n=2 Tax=Xanthomonas citri TaxID=346 RepID=UPI0030C8CE6A
MDVQPRASEYGARRHHACHEVGDGRLAPLLATAKSGGITGGTFGGITAFLKSITQLLIYEWGYYIGIITLAIQGYRWKSGRIDLMTLGGWGLGIGLVFFAPNIVSDLKARSSGSIQ